MVEHPADVSPARLETPPPPQAGDLSSVAEPAPRVYYVGEVMDNGHIAGHGPGAAMRDDPVFSTPGGAQGTSQLPKNAPDFVVSPGGTAFPVPKGAMGPVSVINPAGNRTGIAFTDGAGGANSKVTTMRIMNPTLPKGSSPGYPKGYIKYENSAFPTPQGVDPYTGKTLPNSLSHFQLIKSGEIAMVDMKKSILKAIRGLKVVDAILDIGDAGVSFENGTSLAIYNNFLLLGMTPGDVKGLIGKAVTDIDEDKYRVSIKFDNDSVIQIDMRDEAYTGPEAMQLRVPGETIVVWN